MGQILCFELISDSAMQTAPTALNITEYSCLWLWVFCLKTLQAFEELKAILLQQ